MGTQIDQGWVEHIRANVHDPEGHVAALISEVERLEAEVTRLEVQGEIAAREIAKQQAQFEDYVRRVNDDLDQLRAERDDAVQSLLAILAPLAQGDTRVHGDGCFCDQCIADACLARLPRAGEG